MEFRFYYYEGIFSHIPYDMSIAITVPQNVFDILYQKTHVVHTFSLEESPLQTYVFKVEESVMYFCADEKCQKIPINISGLNLYFVLLWLIQQLGKNYDYVGKYTPFVTENQYHPAKLAMMAVTQVADVVSPEKYSIINALEWSINQIA